jgi:hypothetical protein
MSNSEQIETALSVLIGCRLSLATSTGDMRRFHFLKPGLSKADTYALHVASPWRIEAQDKIITGSGDYYIPADVNKPFDANANEPLSSLQDYRLHELMGGFDATLGAILNQTDHLDVISVLADRFCGAEIALSGDYRVRIFPTVSRGEAWRLLPPQPGQHFVIWDGVPELH